LPQRLRSLSLAPNSFRLSTAVVIDARATGRVALEICDVSGRRVNTVPLGHLEAGLHQVGQDGRIAEGNEVGSAV
jgi:flagellar hook assembly protein FlgD